MRTKQNEIAGSLQEKTGAAAKHKQKHTADCTALQSVLCISKNIKGSRKVTGHPTRRQDSDFLLSQIVLRPFNISKKD